MVLLVNILWNLSDLIERSRNEYTMVICITRGENLKDKIKRVKFAARDNEHADKTNMS